MKLIAAFMPLLLVAGCQGQQDRLKADIERIGGSVEFDDQAPGKPLATVDLHGVERVESILPRLEGQIHLRALDLGGTDISDAGLVSLRRMTELEELNLSATQIGDDGLEYLVGLIQLRELGLGGTKDLQEALPRVAIQSLRPTN